MIAGCASLGCVSLGSVLQDPGAIVDTLAFAPLRLSLRGVDTGTSFQANSLDMTETQSQPTTCRFVLVNPAYIPEEGDPVLLRFHDYILFAGTIDRITKQTWDLRVFSYECEALDHSFILMRRRVRRNFTDAPIVNILSSLLEIELAGEQLTIGRIESPSVLPLVDAKNAPAFDICRDMAAMTGQIFYVSPQGTIEMRSTTLPTTPFPLTESVFELSGTGIRSDREAYRNVQLVIVTGTPLNGGEALTVMVERANDDQIADRAAIEGGSGRYEAIEEVTHPTSNARAQLVLLGEGVANGLLGLAGTVRTTLTGTVRGYGFHAGQVATVTLPTFGVSGEFEIQRVRTSDQFGTGLLRHELELVSSGLQMRAWDRWLKVVRQGKVLVHSLFVSTESVNTQLYTTPGVYNFEVPVDVTLLTIETQGGSGGGGGGAKNKTGYVSAYGGKGGNSGSCVSSVSVTPGETLTVTVGSRGLGGATHSNFDETTYGINGTSGTASSVKRGATVLSQANGGTRGTGGAASEDATFLNGTNGANGGGSDGIVTVGGGKIGGSKGNGASLTNGGNGQHGSVEVRW